MINESVRPVYPCLWFDRSAKEAAAFSCSIFRDTRTINETLEKC